MGNNNRVVKFRRRRTINIGIVVFLIMFVYIAINVYLYFTKEHLSIYEVKEGTTAEDNVFTGLILRDETIMYSDQAGYISYFQKEGSRISKNASVYSVNDHQISDIVSGEDTSITLTKENKAQIKFEITNFQKTFSEDNFAEVYEFKEDAQSTVLEVLNTSMIEQGQKILEESGTTYSYQIFASQKSGIISYYIDSYESVTPDTVSLSMFETENYERTSLRTTEMVSQNSPIYKLITTENWSIILPLSLEQYERLSDKEQVKITILKDEYETSAKLNLYQNGSEYYAQLNMEKLLSNYIGERFLELKLDFGAVEGLKIPLSSMVEKDFYLVPLNFFTKGANSDSDGLTKETYDKNGAVTYSFVATEIYFKDETYGYVDTNLFATETWIRLPNSSERFQLKQTSKLTGVYNVNMGYAVFRRIKLLFQNDEYCIIEKDTPYGLSVYDHIALDGKTAVEQKIIY